MCSDKVTVQNVCLHSHGNATLLAVKEIGTLQPQQKFLIFQAKCHRDCQIGSDWRSSCLLQSSVPEASAEDVKNHALDRIAPPITGCSSEPLMAGGSWSGRGFDLFSLWKILTVLSASYL